VCSIQIHSFCRFICKKTYDSLSDTGRQYSAVPFLRRKISGENKVDTRTNHLKKNYVKILHITRALPKTSRPANALCRLREFSLRKLTLFCFVFYWEFPVFPVFKAFSIVFSWKYTRARAKKPARGNSTHFETCCGALPCPLPSGT
jgi:hypothetical protein